MKEISIIASVGENAKNRNTDVLAIQEALNYIIQYNILAPLATLKEDGIAGRNTKVAIRQFQRIAVGVSIADGRIDVGGKTLAKLNAVLSAIDNLPNHSLPGSNLWQQVSGLESLLSKVFHQFNQVQFGLLAGYFNHKSITTNPGTNADLGALSKSEFVRQVYEAAKKEEEISKVPAAITTAQAILETGYGKSVPTDLYTKQYSYNLFGIKGIGPAGSVSVYTHEVINKKRITIIDKFEAYHSFTESIKGRTKFLSGKRRYKKLFETSDPKKWANGLQDAGYATDPNYAKMLISIMDCWKLI